MAIHTSEQFREEAKLFFFMSRQFLGGSTKKQAEAYALEYVKARPDTFKYRDDVEAGVLVDWLVNLGYIEFVISDEKSSSLRITKEGQDFIDR
jgi:hypothetical protein